MGTWGLRRKARPHASPACSGPEGGSPSSACGLCRAGCVGRWRWKLPPVPGGPRRRLQGDEQPQTRAQGRGQAGVQRGEERLIPGAGGHGKPGVFEQKQVRSGPVPLFLRLHSLWVFSSLGTRDRGDRRGAEWAGGGAVRGQPARRWAPLGRARDCNRLRQTHVRVRACARTHVRSGDINHLRGRTPRQWLLELSWCGPWTGKVPPGCFSPPAPPPR